jgi:hypothetical protein
MAYGEGATMTSEANEQTGSRPKKSGKPWVSRLVPYLLGGGAGVLIYGGALRWFPLLNGIDSPFFYPLAGAGFVVTIAAITWWAGGPRAFKLKGRPSSWVSWVGYGSLYGLIIVGVVAIGVGGAFATWGLFVTLNGALDFGHAAQRSYAVADFHEDCGGARAKDKSYYLLEPSGTQGGDGSLRARVNCSEDEGLPVDGGGVVPVGGEVVVEIKPGAFGEPWQAGYRAG